LCVNDECVGLEKWQFEWLLSYGIPELTPQECVEYVSILAHKGISELYLFDKAKQKITPEQRELLRRIFGPKLFDG